MSKRNNSGLGDSDSAQRLGSLTWELAEMCNIFESGDIIGTAAGERFTFTITANLRVYIKDVDISNRGLDIRISEEMEQIVSMEEKIQNLEERNRAIMEALCNIQQAKDE
jgi:hypothetical protein